MEVKFLMTFLTHQVRSNPNIKVLRIHTKIRQLIRILKHKLDRTHVRPVPA